MSIRLLLAVAAVPLFANLGGCASIMGGDALSDPDGSQRMERMRMITQGLSAYSSARAGGVPVLPAGPSKSTNYAPQSGRSGKCLPREMVCTNGDSSCLALPRCSY